MKGLELAERFYETYGKPMLTEQFGSVCDQIAVGLAGEGSECLGFDDGLSTDHDFEPGFCLWIPNDWDEKQIFRLERAYAKLPKSFEGYLRQPLSPVGGNRHGVMTVSSFYRRYLGTDSAPVTAEQWLWLPSSALRNACNGKVFCDKSGNFSAIREILLQGYPEDVRRKKIAAHAVSMAQSGLYNYERCLTRGEHGAAQLAVFEFVRHAISTVYLLNRVYEPFYKWAYRGLRELPLFSELETGLTALTEMGNAPEEAAAKSETIEEIAALFCDAYRRQGLSARADNDLEKQGYAIQNGIRDPSLRQRHILYGAD